MDINVCLIRRMTPDDSIALSRSITTGSGTLASLAISANGSSTNPEILSSETARICALSGSVISDGIVAVGISNKSSLYAPSTGHHFRRNLFLRTYRLTA